MVDVALRWRYPHGCEHLRVATLRITGVPLSTNLPSSKKRPHLTTWENLAVDCRDWINNHPDVKSYPTSQRFRLIHVEITAPELSAPRYFGPADKYIDQYDSWQADLHGILRSCSLEQHVQAMTMLRIGYWRPDDKHPLTILILLSRDFRRTKLWDDVEREIQTYLRNQLAIHDVASSVEWGDVFRTAFELVPPNEIRNSLVQEESYQQRVNLGANIGCAKYQEIHDEAGRRKKYQSGCGTLGGYLEYWTAKHPGWFKAGPTCYHVVRPIIPASKSRQPPSRPSRQMTVWNPSSSPRPEWPFLLVLR